MKEKVNTPIIVGAVIGLIVIVSALAYFFLRGPDSSAISAANAPAYTKQGGGAANYGSTYGQAPNAKRPPTNGSGAPQ